MQQFTDEARYNLFSGGLTIWNQQSRFGSLVQAGNTAPVPSAQNTSAHHDAAQVAPRAQAASPNIEGSLSWTQQQPRPARQQHEQRVVPGVAQQQRQYPSSDATVNRKTHHALFPAKHLTPGCSSVPQHQNRRHSFSVPSEGSPVGMAAPHRRGPARSSQSMEEVDSIIGGRRVCDSSTCSSMKWKPKKPPKYKGRFYPVIGGREGSCLYKKKKHAIKQTKGLPTSAMKAFNLYEKAKGWLDEQLSIDIEWMTKKELARYTRTATSNPTSGDSGGESDSDDEGLDAGGSQDKVEKVFSVVRSKTGQPVIVCTRYPLFPSEASEAAEAPPTDTTTVVLGSFISYRAADAFAHPNAAPAPVPKHSYMRASTRERVSYQQMPPYQHYAQHEQQALQWGRQYQQRGVNGHSGDMDTAPDGRLPQRSWGTGMQDVSRAHVSPTRAPPPAPPARPSGPFYPRQQPQHRGLYGAPGSHRSVAPQSPQATHEGARLTARWEQAKSSSSDDDSNVQQAFVEGSTPAFNLSQYRGGGGAEVQGAYHQYEQYSGNGGGRYYEDVMSESHPDYIAGMLKDLWETGAADTGSSSGAWRLNNFSS